jgi:nucleoside-diphosphate-sugar epimerase
MTIYQSSLWWADIDRALETVTDLSVLEGQSVFITGATGLIGSALTDVLIRWNETHSGKIGLGIAGRSKERVDARFGEFASREYFSYVPYDATDDSSLPNLSRFAYVIHGAANAYPSLFMEQPAETMLGCFQGLYRLLSVAKAADCRRVLVISSSEVYGQRQSDQPAVEEESGFVRLLDPRSSYSMGKRAAETLCACFAAEYGLDTVIARPGHIYGPTATIRDNRISSQFAWQAARGENLIMKSDGSSLRSYCYCLDCATALLVMLLKGQSGCAYNISNPDSVITVRRMAEMLAKAGDVELVQETATVEEKKGFNPMTNSSLDGSKLAELGWTGLFDAETGLGHTVRVLREIL